MRIISFANLPWSNFWKRHQSILYELSKDNNVGDVIYINPDVWLSSIVNPRTVVKNRANRFVNNNLGKVNIYEYMHIYKNFGCYIKKNRGINEIRNIVNHKIPYDYNIAFINNPLVGMNRFHTNLLDRASIIVFDMSDDFSEFYSDEQQLEMEKNIRKLVAKSDLVLAVNEHLKLKYSSSNKNIEIVSNATNYNNFDLSAYCVIKNLDQIKKRFKKIIGYSGWINEIRINFKILDYIVKNRDYAFVFVGPATSTMKKRYTANNVFFMPAVPYTDLPHYINYFDVAIIPFLVNNHTKGNDLLKIHDYHATGKPIVSTCIGGADRYKDVIYIANERESFMECIHRAALEERNQELTALRKKYAYENSWSKKIIQIKNAIGNAYYLKFKEKIFG